MNNTLKVIALVLLLMSSAGYSQDFDKGQKAYASKDYATALREWSPLAEQGNVKAQFNLASMYHSGRGVTQDYKEAVKWFRLAAEQGYMDAQALLGVMYALGHGVTQDKVYAHMWANIAASSGGENAAKTRDIYAEEMTASQIEKAQELARECVQKNYKGC
jgi:uncharacterized protein